MVNRKRLLYTLNHVANVVKRISLNQIFIGPMLALSMSLIISGSASADLTIPDENQGAECHSEFHSEIIALARRTCMSLESMHNGDCHEFIENLIQISNPTPEQRRALAIGYHTASTFEPEPGRSSEMYQYVVNAMRSLVKDYPDDPRWVYELALVEQDNGQKAALFQHVLELDPACFAAARELADILSESDSNAGRAKAHEYMLYAYEHDADENKLRHARDYMEYIEYSYRHSSDVYSRNREMRKAKNSFRTRVVEDLDLDNLPFDGIDRVDSIGLICSRAALGIGTEALCLDAIFLLASRDMEAGYPLGMDVLQAIRSLAIGMLHGKDSRLNYDIVHEFGADAKYVIHLRDVLDSVPEDGRTLQYYETYAWIVGPKRRSHILKKALELDSKDGQSWLNLAETYMALEQYAEAEAVYRRIIMNVEGQSSSSSIVDKSHEAIAKRRLSDLKDILSRNGG